jgi:hypothetical protein
VAALPAAARTGSAACLAPSALRACERFGPVTLVTTAAGVEELAGALGKTRWGPRWRRRLRQVIVEDPAAPAALQALRAAGVRVEDPKTW